MIAEALGDILRRAGKGLEESILFLPKAETWTLDTLGFLIDDEELSRRGWENDEEIELAGQSRLIYALYSDEIEAVVDEARRIDPQGTDQWLVESFVYYCKYGAYLPESGYIPPPRDEYLYKFDRQFYDSLSEENPDVPCKTDGCDRGSLRFSVFCKVHHFQMVRKRPCPFSH